ncbi:MAG: sulfite exporter TauE/SafE family protein [Sphingopyxis sp.]|nr:sulfite exporter TauE/SafE family protein [Sphingopyxis sp.]
MDPNVFAILLFGAAFLYSAVGHGGASAYLALMAIVEFAPEEMRPLALVLNLFVSAIAFIQFRRTGAFNLRLFLMFAIAAIPMAYLGGSIELSGDWYRRMLGVGGGIFLSPMLIFMRWAEARTVAGISAAFIFCNSAAGLLGQGASLSALPASTPLFIGAVVAGGLIGSGLSATRLPRVALIRLLALVLVIAGGKLIGT